MTMITILILHIAVPQPGTRLVIQLFIRQSMKTFLFGQRTNAQCELPLNCNWKSSYIILQLDHCNDTYTVILLVLLLKRFICTK